MYQKIILIGNLGSDPEMRYLESGSPVTNFNLATNRKYKDEKETTWFRVTVWGSQGEACNNYLQKGSKALVEGRLTPNKDTGGPRVYERKDGTPSASFEVIAERVVFLSVPADNKKKSDQPYDDSEYEYEDEVPF